MLPASSKRTTRLIGKLAGTKVQLADGSWRWALFSNIDPANAQLTEHFLSLSLFVAGRWFHLARYHDIDAVSRGPRALARRLRGPVNSVFPIRYDIRPFVNNAPAWLEGVVHRTPRPRLSGAKVIALAVP